MPGRAFNPDWLPGKAQVKNVDEQAALEARYLKLRAAAVKMRMAGRFDEVTQQTIDEMFAVQAQIDQLRGVL
jgi:hypothetical protein